ncbi:MAG: hypothetical protein R2736_12170 [Solirubrobacterales bacterium]
MPRPSRDPVRARDRALRSARRTTRTLVVGGTALTVALSLMAARAVRGHAQATPAAPAETAPPVTVPPPQHVPHIAGAPPAPRPPAEPPAPAPPPTPPAAVSGGS